MKLSFSPYPGAHERQLIRRANNPLFPRDKQHVLQVEINLAQRHDADEALAFQEDFRALVQRAIDLSPQEDSEVILKLKEDLDQGYERCCGLAGDTEQLKSALKKLLGIVMQAVWRGAADDVAAHSNLREEEIARETHFQLLEQPLIADLIRPGSLIEADELVPTLLSESEAAVTAALGIFDTNQLAEICEEGRNLLQSLDKSSECEIAFSRLALLERHLQQL
ncbi:MAG: hypothetical protein KKE76_00720 [Gammaproteobacteria bacterium]|nr:hypothetical protein [Gammaproteobacteria bacterium]